MMFLEYFIWGAWYVTMGTYLGKTLKFQGRRHRSGLQHCLNRRNGFAILRGYDCGPLLRHRKESWHCCTSWEAGSCTGPPRLQTFGSFFPALLGYTLCYMPTLALTNSLSFHHMKDPSQEFPRVRVLGTIGWIVAGLGGGPAGLEAVSTPMKIAAGASVLMGLYCLLLPHTPPKQGGAPVTFGGILGLDASATDERPIVCGFRSGLLSHLHSFAVLLRIHQSVLERSRSF